MFELLILDILNLIDLIKALIWLFHKIDLDFKKNCMQDFQTKEL